MFKKIFMFLVVVVAMATFVSVSFAMCGMCETGEQKGEAQSVAGSVSTQAVDVGNKICPVTGEKIDEDMKVTYEHEGKVYNFCCAMCIDDFKKDPEKYIAKIEEGKL